MSIEFMQRMLESYDRVHNARYWDEIAQVIDKIEFEEKTVIDLGCGPGLLLADIVRKYTPRRIIGIDLSPIMLNRADEEIKKVVSSSGKQVEVKMIQQHLQDDSSLPSNLDFVFSSRVLRSFENQPQIMNSIYSSLNKDGYFILLDWTKNSIISYEKWFKQVDNEFDNLSSADIIAYHRNFSRYDLTDWKYILESSNFEILHQFQLDAVHSCVIAKK